MKWPRFVPVLILLLAAVTAVSQTGAPGSLVWKAGAASAKITPETMMWMAGYASRTAPAEGIKQDLFAKALVIDDAAGARFALVTLDLIGVPRALRLNVAKRVESELGIDAAHLALNASHTHSGPELRAKEGGLEQHNTEEAAAYTAKLEDTIVNLIKDAAGKSAPASIEYGQSRCGFAMNRRSSAGSGQWNNFPNPAGPVDHAVPVLRIAGADAKELAIVFGYSCHCTTLGHQKFSGDYAGYAQEYLQTEHPTAIAMFMNGCSGDQNPYPRRTTELAQIHGRTLATAVEAALTTKLKPLTGPLRAAYREIPLAFDTLPTRESLLAQQKSADKYEASHATRLLARLDAGEKLPADYPYPVQVVRLGTDLTWIGLGGEVVVDYSLRLKQEVRDPIVWVAGYTNDVMAYIPSLRVWAEGGYEGGGAMKYYLLPTRWSNLVEEHITGTVFALRQSLN